MIVCGWCHAQTAPGSCSQCGRDPALPWTQRAQEPPTPAEFEASNRRRRIAAARHRLETSGQKVTDEAMAELLGVSPRTVSRWREMADK